MTVTDTIMYEFEEGSCNLSNEHYGKITNKKIWKSLRKHILSRREKRKQAESDAEVLKNKIYLENKKIQETKLSLAQINSRLSELRDRINLLEGEKRALLEQSQINNNTDSTKPETDDGDIKPGTNCNVNGESTITPFSKHQQTMMDIISNTRSDMVLAEALSNEALPVVIPTKNSEGKQNYWIIHHPV